MKGKSLESNVAVGTLTLTCSLMWDRASIRLRSTETQALYLDAVDAITPAKIHGGENNLVRLVNAAYTYRIVRVPTALKPNPR